MSLLESKDELITEVTSEVDVLVDVMPSGIGISVYIDEELFSDDATWEDMATRIIADIRDNMFDDEETEDILMGFKHLINEIENATGRK